MPVWMLRVTCKWISSTAFSLYGVFLLTMGGIYAVLTLGLNIHWGFTGLFNAGVAGFFAIGAYTTAIVTTAASERHLGGFGLPVAAGMVAAMFASAIIALGSRPNLHSAARRLPRDRHPRNRRDLPPRPQERGVGDQRHARDLAHPQALRASSGAVEPGRDACSSSSRWSPCSTSCSSRHGVRPGDG